MRRGSAQSRRAAERLRDLQPLFLTDKMKSSAGKRRPRCKPGVCFRARSPEHTGMPTPARWAAISHARGGAAHASRRADCCRDLFRWCRAGSWRSWACASVLVSVFGSGTLRRLDPEQFRAQGCRRRDSRCGGGCHAAGGLACDAIYLQGRLQPKATLSGPYETTRHPAPGSSNIRDLQDSLDRNSCTESSRRSPNAEKLHSRREPPDRERPRTGNRACAGPDSAHYLASPTLRDALDLH